MNNKGTTFIEVLVSIAIVSFLVVTIYLTLTKAVSNMGEAKQRVGAIAIANEKMEIMRNLDYDEVGVVGGIVNGPMLASETVTRNNFDYKVYIDVRYIDDEFDGTGINDSIPTDYKFVEVTVNWNHLGTIKSVQFSSNFVPDGIETNMGGGTLVLNTMTSGGNNVPGVTITLDSIEDSPSVNYTTTTDNQGGLVLQGVPNQTYRISLSKTGYENIRTYPNPPGSSFTPIDSDFYVNEGALNSKNFLIDLGSDLKFIAIDAIDGSDISGIDINLKGGREIGSEPTTYNLDDTATTDSNGEISYDNISPGAYEIVNWQTMGVGDYKYVGSTDKTNFNLEAGVNEELKLIFADKNNPSLFLSVVDDATGDSIEGAVVGVVGLNNFDQSTSTGENGDAFFPLLKDPPVLMENVEYTVEVRITGYQDYSSTVTVNNLTEKEIRLISI